QNLDVAERTADDILSELLNEQASKQNPKAHLVTPRYFCQDYASMVFGLLELYFSTSNEKWLQGAQKLQTEQIRLYWDKNFGGFFVSSEKSSESILRLKDDLDSTTPSCQSLSAYNLLRIADLTQSGEFQKMGTNIFELA